MTLAHLSKDKEILILFTFLAVAWGGVTLQLLFSQGLSITPPAVLPLVLVLAAMLGVVTGGNKVTSMLSKAVVAVSVLTLATHIIQTTSFSFTATNWVIIAALASGLVIERISPHQPLFMWMYIMLAVKVEIILVSAIVIHLASLLLMPAWVGYGWWSVVVALAVSAPALAFRFYRTYRAIVLLTTVLALGWCAVYIYGGVVNTQLHVLLLAAATLWPIMVHRLVGRTVFRTAAV